MTVKKIEKKKIRLIGLDLDGTTLTTDKRLTPHTKEVLEACIRQGIEVLPATGRVWSGIPKELTDIEGVRYVISSNGAAVVELATGKAVYTNGIGWERALEIFDLLEEYDTFYDAYAMGNGWCEGRFYDDRSCIWDTIISILRHPSSMALASFPAAFSRRERLTGKVYSPTSTNVFPIRLTALALTRYL